MSWYFIGVEKTTLYNDWTSLKLSFYLEGNLIESFEVLNNNYRRSIDEAEEIILRDLYKKFPYLKFSHRKIETGFVGFRHFLYSGTAENFVDLSKEQALRITHVSCKNHCKSAPATRSSIKKNGVPQEVVKHKLKTLDKNSEAMKFLKENQYPVCLESFEEILNGDFHLVESQCRHPLCCRCLDQILGSENPACPLCRSNDYHLYTFQKLNFDKETFF